MQTREYREKNPIRGGEKTTHAMKTLSPKFFNAKEQKAKRQALRNNATPAEKKLWSSLRKSGLFNYKFRRQHGIGPYIADFYSPEARLAIELDGGADANNEAYEYDKERDKFFCQNNIETIRFRNEQVFKDMDNVLQTIAEYLKSHHP